MGRFGSIIGIALALGLVGILLLRDGISHRMVDLVGGEQAVTTLTDPDGLTIIPLPSEGATSMTGANSDGTTGSATEVGIAKAKAIGAMLLEEDNYIWPPTGTCDHRPDVRLVFRHRGHDVHADICLQDGRIEFRGGGTGSAAVIAGQLGSIIDEALGRRADLGHRPGFFVLASDAGTH